MMISDPEPGAPGCIGSFVGLMILAVIGALITAAILKASVLYLATGGF